MWGTSAALTTRLICSWQLIVAMAIWSFGCCLGGLVSVALALICPRPTPRAGLAVAAVCEGLSRCCRAAGRRPCSRWRGVLEPVLLAIIVGFSAPSSCATVCIRPWSEPATIVDRDRQLDNVIEGEAVVDVQRQRGLRGCSRG